MPSKVEWSGLILQGLIPMSLADLDRLLAMRATDDVHFAGGSVNLLTSAR